MQPYPYPSQSRHPSRLSRWGVRLLLSLSVGLACFGAGSTAAHAAKRVVLTFDETQVQVPLSVLEIYARTGIATDQLSEFLGVSPEVQSQARRALTHEVEVSDRLFRQALRGSTGEFVLSRLQEFLRTEGRGRRGSNQLRETLIESYQDDNRISLLEVLKRYPEDEVHLDVRGLQNSYSDVAALIERFGPFFDLLRGSVQNQICDCDTAAETTPARQANATLPPRMPALTKR